MQVLITLHKQVKGRSEVARRRQHNSSRSLLNSGVISNMMEPFAYEDYSDIDADELDFEPPTRRGAKTMTPRRSFRSSSPFELGGEF